MLPNVTLIDHPVIRTKLTELRDFAIDHSRFRMLLEEISMLMTYEVTRTWPTTPRPVRSPLEDLIGSALARQVTVVPILRAGLGMASGVLRLLPEARVGHLGMSRNETTLEPEAYYHKLPPDVAETEVLLIDPMLATGGSAVAGVDFLKARGVHSIRMVSLLAAPEGLQRLTEAHPDVPIYTAAIDRELNDRGFILPGLGDAGDRCFGT